MWFLKIIFFVPKFAPNLLILQLAGLNSIESEINIGKLLFLGRLLIEPKRQNDLWLKAFFSPELRAILIQILSQLVFYQVSMTPCVNKFYLPTLKLGFTTLSFLVTRNGSQLFTVKCVNSEINKWTEYCVSHPNLHLAKACVDTDIPPQQFWSITDQYPDLVRHLHVQVRLLGNLGLSAGGPWLSDTQGRS